MENAAGNLDILKVIFLKHLACRTQISLLLYSSENSV
jgi:hypothetical protein